VCAAILCGAGGSTSFAYAGGGSATIGAQVLSANAFLQVKQATTLVYLPVFTSVTAS
jgi:hypothetical protein